MDKKWNQCPQGLSTNEDNKVRIGQPCTVIQLSQ